MSDWQLITIKKITNLIKDGTHGSHKDEPGGIPLLSAKDINNGNITFDNNPRLISKSDFDAIHKTYSLVDNDILLTIVGSLGRVAQVKQYANDYTLQRSVAILRFNDSVDSRFMYHAMCEWAFQKELKKRESKGAQGGVYLGEIAKIKMSLPPKPEQERIVGVLEVWDEYLELLDKKIALKERLKKGLMQQLLTGKKRLPGFSGEWRKLEIKNIFDFIPTYSHSKVQMTYQEGDASSVYCIHYGDVHTKFDSYIEIGKHIVPHLLVSEQIPNNRLLEQGDVIVVDASEDYAGIGSSVEIINLHEKQCIAGLHTLALRPKPDMLSLGYGALLFQNTNVHKTMMKIATYSKVYGITKAGFSETKTALPTISEQNIIADILRSISDEVDCMRKKSRLIQSQKKYLLKNLITGTIRTPENLRVKEARHA